MHRKQTARPNLEQIAHLESRAFLDASWSQTMLGDFLASRKDAICLVGRGRETGQEILDLGRSGAADPSAPPPKHAAPAPPGAHERLAGYILVQPMGADSSAEIIRIAVDPQFRRQGWGLALLDRACALLDTTGIKRLFLEVSARNDGARAFYAAQGFHATGARKAYYADGADACLMERPTFSRVDP